MESVPETNKSNLYINQTPVCNANNILVFSPHEDDETIACAGIIRRAVENGNNIKIVMVTTGDYSDPKVRIKRTIKSMALLGLTSNNIIYLGYGNHTVLQPAYFSKKNPKKIFKGPNGRKTYGFPKKGIVDYHFEKYGVHADYNRENIFNDISEIIEDTLPQNIYMPSAMESHPDHSATALFIISAIIDLKKRINYSPIIHEYMIYKQGLPQNNENASEPVSDIESNMDKTTPYLWRLRESVAVPDCMRASLESGKNLKSKAFDAYKNDAVPFRRFIKSDEVFWKRQMSSLAYKASVIASSQNTATGQYCTNVIDGIALGYPYLNETEWATLGENAGAWIKLEWPGQIEANRIILYDRTNLNDQIIRGTLTFSDGYKLSVGPLPNNGSGYAADFKTRSFKWVKLMVDKAKGHNTGLSEFEVYNFK